jgi:hypothetical protein
MKVQAATISLQDANFAVVVVSEDLLKSPGEADMAIERFEPVFGGVPVLLMAQNDKGSPTYYGDRDLVRSLADIPIERMPWKEYSVG